MQTANRNRNSSNYKNNSSNFHCIFDSFEFAKEFTIGNFQISNDYQKKDDKDYDCYESNSQTKFQVTGTTGKTKYPTKKLSKK